MTFGHFFIKTLQKVNSTGAIKRVIMKAEYPR